MGNYRLYSRQANGEQNPDGSPCKGYVYQSFDLRSYADRGWLESRQYVPGRTWLYRTSQPTPVNFFEPKPVTPKLSHDSSQRDPLEGHQKGHQNRHLNSQICQVEWRDRRDKITESQNLKSLKH